MSSLQKHLRSGGVFVYKSGYRLSEITLNKENMSANDRTDNNFH